MSDRWRVVHPVDGTAHVEGETLTVPAYVAEEWARSAGSSASPAKVERYSFPRLGRLKIGHS